MAWREHVEITHIFTSFFLVCLLQLVELFLALVPIDLFQSLLGIVFLVMRYEPPRALW